MSNLFLGNTFESPRKVNGDVNSGGLVYFYKPGTSELKNTYTDSTLATAHANPVVLDSYGRNTIFLNGNYKVRVETSGGVLIAETDKVNPPLLSDSDRYNKVLNGDFEDATLSSTLPDEWTITLYTGGAAALDSTNRHSGLKSLKFTSTGTGGGYADTDNFFAVSPGVPVTVSFSIYSSVADVRNKVDILWYTSAKVLDSTTSLYDDSTTNPTSFTSKTVSATPPSTATYAKLRIIGCHSSDATAGSTWFDKVIVDTGFGILNNLPVDSTPDRTADYLLTYDASASALKKVLISTQDSMVLISRVTASAAATVDFTAINNTLYDHYVLVGDNITPGTNAVQLLMRFSVAGAFESGAGAYEHHAWRWTSAGSGVGGSTADSAIQIVSVETLGTGANQYCSFNATIFNPTNGARKQVTWSATGLFSSGSYVSLSGGGRGLLSSLSDMDGIRILASSGTLSGTFSLYGMRRA